MAFVFINYSAGQRDFVIIKSFLENHFFCYFNYKLELILLVERKEKFNAFITAHRSKKCYRDEKWKEKMFSIASTIWHNWNQKFITEKYKERNIIIRKKLLFVFIAICEVKWQKRKIINCNRATEQCTHTNCDGNYSRSNNKDI